MWGEEVFNRSFEQRANYGGYYIVGKKKDGTFEANVTGQDSVIGVRDGARDGMRPTLFPSALCRLKARLSKSPPSRLPSWRLPRAGRALRFAPRPRAMTSSRERCKKSRFPSTVRQLALLPAGS